MISIRHVSKSFGKNAAIDDFSLEIAAGEHVVLLGPSGSGKTTLLRMINGLVTPTSGAILINGRDIAEQPGYELRRQIGYVLQRVFQERFQVIWLKPIGFNNTYAVMMRTEDAKRLGIRTISDLSNYLNPN